MLPARGTVFAVTFDARHAWVVASEFGRDLLQGLVLDEFLLGVEEGLKVETVDLLVVLRVLYVLQVDCDLVGVRCSGGEHSRDDDSSGVRVDFTVLRKELVCVDEAFGADTVYQTDLRWVDKFDAALSWKRVYRGERDCVVVRSAELQRILEQFDLCHLSGDSVRDRLYTILISGLGDEVVV